ncbi:carboxypeptidase regulatory-like domain-containing protein [Longispora sp. NPDC051575]|uniref:carboxypeptidase regulatory-like domain-containing protein n=1 Tax=Longispora sp. NPDC051575 TaxID=3154943 RepID=UPI003412E34E
MSNPAGGVLTLRLSPSLIDAQVGFADSGGCTPQGTHTVECQVTGNKSFVVKVGPPAASNIPNGKSIAGKVEISFNPTTGSNVNKDIDVKLTGATQGGILGVTGTVTDAAGAAVTGADVKATDSTGKVRGTTTNEQGAYVIDVRSDPFKVGTISIQVSKSGFAIGKLTRTGVADQPITNADVKLALSASPSASASASASVAPSAAPSAEASSSPQADPKTGKGDGGTSLLTWLIVAFGVLLIGGGGAAIFFLLRKGKDDDDSGAAPPTPTVYGGPGGTPSRRPAADDSPTMMHQGPLVVDDPYGDPAPYGGGYGGRTDQYGAPADPYAAPPAAAPPTQQYGRPSDPYAAPPTQQYGGRPAADPYADQTRQYGAQPAQHEERTQQYRPEQPPQGQQPGPRQPENRRPLDWLDD